MRRALPVPETEAEEQPQAGSHRNPGPLASLPHASASASLPPSVFRANAFQECCAGETRKGKACDSWMKRPVVTSSSLSTHGPSFALSLQDPLGASEAEAGVQERVLSSPQIPGMPTQIQS